LLKETIDTIIIHVVVQMMAADHHLLLATKPLPPLSSWRHQKELLWHCIRVKLHLSR